MPGEVVHCCTNAYYDIYIGRGHGKILGNPYSHKEHSLAEFKVASVAEAVSSFETYARERMKKDPSFRVAIRNCYGKTLGCWCKKGVVQRGLCHGVIIHKLADELVAEEESHG